MSRKVWPKPGAVKIVSLVDARTAPRPEEPGALQDVWDAQAEVKLHVILLNAESRHELRAGFGRCQQIENAQKVEAKGEWRNWARMVVETCVKRVDGVNFADGSDISMLSGPDLATTLDNLDWLELAAFSAFVAQAPRPEQLD